jgi:hypothetical protein
MLASVLAPIHAQSLADVARKEQQRRKATKQGGKVYTNGDLVAAPAPEPDAAAGSAAAVPAEPGKQEIKGAEPQTPPGEKVPAKDEAYWSKRAKDVRDQVERDTTYVEALQTRINSLTTDFVNRDDPAQRTRIGVDRQKAIAELDRLKKSIEDGRKALSDLEDEARRAGVPAGWLR